jgi:modulator of FtsH protease
MSAPAAAANGWENFFVAEAGAAAALSGLLFVAVSINLARILSFPHLPGRAAETLTVLVGVLLIATFGLVPGQGAVLLGSEILATGLVMWGVSVRSQLRTRIKPDVGRPWLWIRVFTMQMASVPFVVAGLGLLFGSAHAIYWVVPGTVASLCSAILNAWVLLVEIQR